MFALLAGSSHHRLRRDLAASETSVDELEALAGEKAASFFKAMVVLLRGSNLVQAGRQAEAIEMLNSGLVALRSTGSRVGVPIYLSSLAQAHADLHHVADASRFIGEALAAIEASGERWYEAEVHGVAGEIALKLRQRHS